MAITGADLFFFGSTSVDGGDMGTVIVQDAVENNVFPDVMPADRAAGVTQLRKVYATVLSNDRDALANAQVGLLARPTDPNVEVCCVKSEDSAGVDELPVVGTSGAVLTALEDAFQTSPIPIQGGGLFCTYGGGSNDLTGIADTSGFEVGDRASVLAFSSGAYFPQGGLVWRRVTAKTASSLTVDGAAPVGSSDQFKVYGHNAASDAFRRVSALSLTTANASAGATALTLDTLDVQVMTPAAAAQKAQTYVSILDRLTWNLGGRNVLYFKGDVVLVQHPSTPATREFATILRINHLTNVVTFTAPLSNAYPTGSKVTLPVTLRTLQANVSVSPFSLQSWNRTWSDTFSGGAITSRYQGLPVLTNEGTVNDRWVCQFVSTTQFTLTSERLGQIASGNTGTDFSPLNPTTNEPYFTLLSSSWGDGWIPGNAMRFNTRAAAAPVWINRCVSPSTAGGTDFATMFIRGDVNA